jgi:putative thioredoxin
MLGPMLDRLAEDYAGKLYVAKVNTDVEQELAQEFQIRGIPAVKIFRHGKMVNEFVGVQPEAAIRALVEPLLPNEGDAVIERAGALARDGKTAEAAALLREAAGLDPQDDRIRIELARILVAEPVDQNHRALLEECRGLLDSLSLRSSTDPEVERLRARLDLQYAAADAPPVEDLKRVVQDNPDDNPARFHLGARHALVGEFEPAMEQFLEVVKRDRSFGDDAARKALVGLFNSLGNKHPLTNKYRALLSRQLN